jgi:ferritin-like metal-binding protein YciE
LRERARREVGAHERKREIHMLSNNTYNHVSLLSEKAQGLELYDTYIEDAEDAGSQECVQLFQQMKEQDAKHVEMLKAHIEMLVKNGKF